MKSGLTPAQKARYDKRGLKARSRISNGRDLLPNIDHRSAAARRFHDILGEVVSDLGGVDLLSEGERQLSKRVAFISVECEQIEAAGINGEAIDLEEYCALVGNLARVLSKLGLKRRARTVSAPTVGEYLKHLAGEVAEAEIVEADAGE